MKIPTKRWGLLPLLLWCFLSYAFSFPSEDPENSQRKTTGLTKSVGTPHFQILNINDVTTWFRDNGNGSYPPSMTGYGTIFPRGTAAVVYEDGIMWGAKVFTDSARTRPAWGTLPIRLGGNEYVQGCLAGWVTGWGASAVAANQNLAEVRMWRIRRDWNTMTQDELRKDAAEFNEIPLSNVTDLQIAALRAQYEKDWNEWSAVVTYGAPYIERNGISGFQPPPAFNYDGTKGPLFTPESLITRRFDEPGIAGGDPSIPADEVLWTAYNDLNRSLTTSLYGSEPVGFEVQVTLWGYKRVDLLKGVYYKRVRIINKGGVDTSGTNVKGSFWLDSLYVSQWCDVDIGYAGDDLLGCDTTLQLAFGYNALITDRDYDVFRLAPASAGFSLLAGPMISGSPSDSAVFNLKHVYGKSNAKISSFSYHAPAMGLTDPRPRSWAWGTPLFYKWLRGYKPNSGPDVLHPFPPGVTPNKFPLSGDPVSQTGILDGLGTNYSGSAGDRRFLLNSGPFQMSPGDTLELYYAFSAGLGGDRLSSISVMKASMMAARTEFASLFSTAGPPVVNAEVTFPTSSTATVFVSANANGRKYNNVKAVLKRKDNSAVSTLQLFDDGVHNEGAALDGVFANSVSVARESMPFSLDVETSDAVLNRTVTYESVDSAITTIGDVHVEPVLFSDNLNGDKKVNPGEEIRYGLTITNNGTTTLANVKVGTDFQNKLSKKLLIPQLAPGATFSSNYNPADSSSFFSAAVYPELNLDILTVPMTITDSLRNKWERKIDFAVVKLFFVPYDTPMTRVAGAGEWDFRAKVVEPAQLRNHKYRLAIVELNNPVGSKGFTLIDKISGDTLLKNNPLPDEGSHNVPVTHGFRIFRGPNFGQKGVDNDSTRWISSTAPWFQGSGLFNGARSGFNGGVLLGFETPNFFGMYGPLRIDPFPVDIKFDTSITQRAYRLVRNLSLTNNNYVIGRGSTGGTYGDTLPFPIVPFTVWDVSNPSAPRQLDVSWRESVRNAIWNPSNGVTEWINIYSSTYDSTGNKFGPWVPGTNTGALTPNIATIGEKADIVYVVDLAILSGHTLNESLGTLHIQPWYGLTQYDRFEFELKVDPQNVPPSAFELSQNYPNPFNPLTNIKFEVPELSDVSIKVYNLLGQDVATVFEGQKDVGRYVIQWEGRDRYGVQLPSGVYFYRMKVGSAAQTKKMLLIR